jgi:RHS repeat-associated protein
VGNRQTKTVNGVTTVYSYDANDRLLNEKVGGVVTAAYTYDDNGSTLSKTENGVVTTYVWNDEKRLIQATVGGTVVDYRYNDAGIRVSSKQNGVETLYLLDEGLTANVWEEYGPSGAVQGSYSYGYDLITQTQAGQASYYLVDGLGSTRLLTDAQGQVLNSYGYEAFGETVSQTGTTGNKYQYAGEQLDGTLGDYYLRQRFYDTSSGRFGRMDTFETGAGTLQNLNKYVYAGNNPAINTDVSGLFVVSPGYAVESATQSELASQNAVIGAAQWNTARNLLITTAAAVANVIVKSMEVSLTTAQTLNQIFKIPIVFWGNDLPEITAHQIRAVTCSGYTDGNIVGAIGMSKFLPIDLHRGDSRLPDAWRYNYPQSTGRSRTLHVDEYPYASTTEGGETNYKNGLVSLHLVNGSQNSSNGIRLRNFWENSKVGVTKNSISPILSLFLNVPVPGLGKSFGLGRQHEYINV